MGQEKVSFLASRETTFSQATSSKNKTTVSTSSHAERVEIEFRSLKIHHDNVSTVVYHILFSRSALVLRASRRVKFRRERKKKRKNKKGSKKNLDERKTITRAVILLRRHCISFLNEIIRVVVLFHVHLRF